MPKLSATFVLVLTSVAFMALPALGAELPTWAFPVSPPAPTTPPPDDGIKAHVPGSTAAFSQNQILNRYNVADWHPAEHPAMPKVVVNGRNPELRACGYCHTPGGAGRPENAAISGLTPTYFKQQVLNFRNGNRPGSEPNRGPQGLMIEVAKAITDAELEEAAAYFASVKPTSYVTVVESATAPKTFVTGSILARLPAGGMEPIGHRIIEVPESLERFENRDPHTPFTAYVPVGSLKRGEDLVSTGGAGRTIQCAICHGPGLKGLGDVPHIAGRSPSYVVRQLYDMQNGKRTGSAALMTAVVAKLTNDDMIGIAAYVASLKP